MNDINTLNEIFKAFSETNLGFLKCLGFEGITISSLLSLHENLDDNEIPKDCLGREIKGARLKEQLRKTHFETIASVNKECYHTECPYCHRKSIKKKENFVKYVKTDKVIGIDSWIAVTYSTYQCCHVDCNKCFKPKNKIVNLKGSNTSNMALAVVERLGQLRSRASIANEMGVSKSYVTGIADNLPEKEVHLGTVLCMDEFKGNLDNPDSKWKDKYQTILVEPKRGIIDVLPTRQFGDLKKYFSQFSKEEREKVKYCISDMSPIFIGIYKLFFPNAIIIIDRYHYTKLIVEAFEKIRTSLQIKSEYKALHIKKSYKMLLMNAQEANENEEIKETLAKIFKGCPQLKKAYDLLQEFYEINRSSDKNVARMKLRKFIEKIEADENMFPEFKHTVKTLKTKFNYIVNSFIIKETNAYAEGKNNLIKVLKRVSFGCKVFSRFKKRILHIQTSYNKLKEKMTV